MLIALASGFGLGRIPAPGTAASVVAWLIVQPLVYFFPYAVVFGGALLFVVGIWSCKVYQERWGVFDASEVVIDEIACVILLSGLVHIYLTIEYSLFWQLCALAFFRFYDIVKPLLIGTVDRRLHKMPLGTMLDDLLAAFAALASVWAIFWAYHQI